MDKQQVKTMGLFGYAVEELPGRTIPRTTYYKVEKGEVVALPGLPADSYHMSRYLKRGFTLKPPVIEPPLPQSEPVGSLVRPVVRRKRRSRKTKEEV